MKTLLAAVLLAAAPAFAAEEEKTPPPPAKVAGQFAVSVKLFYAGRSYEESILCQDGTSAHALTSLSDELTLSITATPTGTAGGLTELQLQVVLEDTKSKRTLFERQLGAKLRREIWSNLSASPAAKLSAMVADAVEGGLQ
ncbi:MAG: hypothetical protein HY928_05915 [Elusimicrobia bacterium]|nr:hypothetical protein [Elusimicrobiota bacterium]